jgi:glycosyltransferase involved in cell wall biosynthesis
MNQENLKIVFLTGDSAEKGTYLRWHNIARGLVDAGHTVSVFCIDFTDGAVTRKEVRDKILYNIIKCSKGKSLFGTVNHPLTSLRRIFVDFPPCDIVHVFQPFLSVYLPWKFKIRNRAAITFFDWDDLWVDDLRKKSKKGFRGNWDHAINAYFEKKIPASGKYMTVCSTFLKNLALQRGASEVDIVPNGCWEYEVPAKSLSREKLGLQQDALYMGFMGRTGFELHWCFDAFAECIQQEIPIRFALCGPAKEELNGIPPEVLKHIDYLGDLTPLDTRYFAAAMDLGLLPLMKTEFNESRFPIKFAEYMAANLPVLCSEVGQIHEYGKNYPWVIKAGINQEEWTAAFIKAAKMLVKKEMPAVDRKTILDTFSWKGISNQVEHIYLKKVNTHQEKYISKA